MRIVPPGVPIVSGSFSPLRLSMVLQKSAGRKDSGSFPFLPSARQSVRMRPTGWWIFERRKSQSGRGGTATFQSLYQCFLAIRIHRRVNCPNSFLITGPPCTIWFPGSRPSVNTGRKMGHASSRALKRSPASPRFHILMRYGGLPCPETAGR
jgi:hypothetical protein